MSFASHDTKRMRTRRHARGRVDRQVRPSSSSHDLEDDPRASISRKTASIVRSITWGFWWRKLVTWLFVDLFVIVVLIVTFMWQCQESLSPAALDGITTTIFGITFVRPENCGFVSASNGLFPIWTYHIIGSTGATYSFPVSGFVSMLTPYAIAAAIFELFDLSRFLPASRRVRRRLQPLNDLAIMAEAIGSATVSETLEHNGNKMATLEAAIGRASVDMPQISTGDADLAGIEIALNGLLRQMQEAKLQQMRFVSDASHELRTPIAVVQGYANMLARWGKSDEAVLDESIEALRGEAEHMHELVEQLLFLARGDSGRNTLQLTTFDLAEVANEVWDESSMIDNTHNYVCTATSTAENDVYGLVADRALVKQSMRIILSNAAKYSPRGSTITLSVATNTTGVSYIVADEGIGMSATDVTHAFDRFWRSDAGRDTGAEGSGLGLSIAKWIVDAHDGTITILTSEDVGTRITVTLPREGPFS